MHITNAHVTYTNPQKQENKIQNKITLSAMQCHSHLVGPLVCCWAVDQASNATRHHIPAQLKSITAPWSVPK